MRSERKARRAAGEGRQLANLKAALKKGGKGAVPNTLQLAAALPEHGRGQPAKRKDLRDNVRSSLLGRAALCLRVTGRAAAQRRLAAELGLLMCA